MTNDAFTHSDGVAFRTPLLPLATLERLTGVGAARAAWVAGAAPEDLAAAVRRDHADLRAGLRALVTEPVVRTALTYASPSLDAALDRWGDDDGALVRALLAYVARMAGRATPFGLFAGCTAGDVAGEPAYALAGHDALRRRSRLDVGVLARVVGRLAADSATRPALTLSPNSTWHVAGGRLRLVERAAGGRFHAVAVEVDDALTGTLARAEGGARAADLAAALTGDDVTLEDAAAYVADLVGEQLLVPDAGPVVTTDDPVAALVAALGDGPAGAALDDAARRVRAADDAAVSPEALHDAVAAVRTLDPSLPADRAVHVDTSRPAVSLVLGDAVLAEAHRAVDVLHPLARASAVDEDLARFRAAYADRYGDAEVPLLEALDEETGVGFGAPTALAAAGAPLLAGLHPRPSTDGPAWTPIDHHLVDLLSRALLAGDQEIELDGADLGPLRTPDVDPLPDAVAVRATVAARSAEAVAAGEFRLLVHEVTGPNGVPVLSRFAGLDPGVDGLVRRHVAAEEALRPDAVFAEVVHLPDGRAGNVAVRPVLRGHEIPVLGVSGAPRSATLPLRDLRVSLAGDRIVLRSERLGRAVLPRLTAADDYRASALPVYRFLGAVQHDGTAGVLRWSWGQVHSAPFLPRVAVGRLVLARAQWHWYRAELAGLRSAGTPVDRVVAIQRLRDGWRVPRWVTVARADNEIPLDLDGVGAAELLAHEARQAGQLTLRELFPRPGDLCVTAPEGRLVHEFVLPLVRRTPVTPPPARPGVPARVFVPGSEWLGVRLSTGVATADAVLREVVGPLVAETDAWFFTRHADPRPHLRLRLHGDPAALVPALRDRVAPLVENGRVQDLLLDVYRAPVPLLERVFHADSDAALRVVAAGDDLAFRWRAALWGVDRLLADAVVDVAIRGALVRRWRDRLVAAHGETGVRAARRAGRVYRRDRALLAAPDAAVSHVLDARSAVVAPVLAELFAPANADGAPQPFDDVLDELCSLHVNRLLRAAHGVQQIVLYDLLDRIYRAQMATGSQPR